MRRGLDGGPLQRPGRGGPSREHGRADTRVKVTSCVSPRTCLQMCPDHTEAERLQAAGRFSLTPHTAPSSCRRAPTTCPAPPRTTAAGVQPAAPAGRARGPRSRPSTLAKPARPGGQGPRTPWGPRLGSLESRGCPAPSPGPVKGSGGGPRRHRGWGGRTRGEAPVGRGT